MSNYYLIALDEHPTVIKIKYGEDYVSSGSLNFIDKSTSKGTKKTIQSHLYSKNKIDNPDTELVIIRTKKYNDRLIIKTYPVMYADSINISNLMDNAGEVRIGDIKEYIVTFMNKYKNEQFKEMVDFPYSCIDDHLLRQTKINFARFFNERQKNVVINEKMRYSDARKIISMLNYDTKYKNLRNYLEGENKINVYIREHFDELLHICDKNNIEGQMNLFSDFIQTDYIKLDDNELKNQSTPIKSYNDEYIDLFYQIKSEPFDDPRIEECIKNNVYDEYLFNTMSYNDQIRCGRIDAIDFKYKMMGIRK